MIDTAILRELKLKRVVTNTATAVAGILTYYFVSPEGLSLERVNANLQTLVPLSIFYGVLFEYLRVKKSSPKVERQDSSARQGQ
ncbi:hypothetical protein SAMN02745129_0747 [Ferrimonas marina]|uniref:Uncharacterized protein n=1 Tax=Ferrimonas marina TaxID=299255 RepID=A0A1M5MRK8_9GAMM|nr:hypothetical protein SAMN02745129_0747 [Ferrimonas marina]